MSDSELHQQIGALVADVKSMKDDMREGRDRFERIEQQLHCIDRKVTQHRVGWQIFMWLGGVAIAIAGVVAGYFARRGG